MNDVRGIFEEAAKIFAVKSAAYSSDNVAMVGQSGVASRCVDKVMRLRTLQNDPGVAGDEAIADTWMDLLVYAAIGVSLDRGEWDKSTRMVYLAGPMDLVDTTESHEWRVKARDWLGARGIASFNPALPYRRGAVAWASVSRINRVAIDECDVLLANVGEGQRTIGTWREIEHARAAGTRVVLVAPEYTKCLETQDCEQYPTLMAALMAVWPDV